MPYTPTPRANGQVPQDTWWNDLQTAVTQKAEVAHAHAGTDITSGTVPVARIGTGTKDTTTFYRGDGTFAAPAGGGGGGGDMLVVAAADSLAVVKSRADYICTGTADQTTINSALTAAGTAAAVVLAAGNYATTAAISLATGQSLLMHSRAVITRSGTGNGIEVHGVSATRKTDVTIEGGRLLGPSLPATQVAGAGVDIVFADRVKVRNVYASGFGSLGDDAGVALLDTSNCLAEGCELTANKNGVCTGAPTSATIRDTGNRFIGNLAYSNFDDGIHLQRGANNIVSNNICHSQPNGGATDGAGIDVLGEEGTTVSGNTCYANARGLEVGNTADVNLPDIGVTLAGNTCRGNTVYGITLVGAMRKVVLVGNIVTNNTTDGVRFGSATAGLFLDDVSLIANEIHDNGTRGVDIFGNVRRPNLRDNNVSGHATADIGVRVSTGTPADYIIVNNRLQSPNKLVDTVNQATSWTFSNHGVSTNPAVGVLSFEVGGNGAAITAGVKGDMTVPFACVVTGWRVTADVPGSIVVDVDRATYANFPTFASIAGTEKPTLVTAQKNEDAALTTWTTALAEGDILRFEAEATPATVQRITITIFYRRS